MSRPLGEDDEAARRELAVQPGQVATQPGETSKARREFTRLTQRVEALGRQVAEWREAESVFRQRAAAEWQPLADKLRLQQREVVLWLDRYLGHPPPGEHLHRRLQAKAVALLRLLAGAVLQDDADAEVQAAHDRHGAPFFTVHQDPPNEPVDDEADWPEWQYTPDPSAQRRGPSRDDKARARDAKALQAASQSVREVWRRLASRLHPDREPDADEHVRKTALMAQVNDAYGRNDLLALLAVQSQLEQAEATRRADVPDERLRRFCRMLEEQRQSLQRELADLQAPVVRHYGGAVGDNAKPAELMARVMDENLKDLRQTLASLRSQFAVLKDPRSRAEYLGLVKLHDDPQTEPDDEPAAARTKGRAKRRR